MTHNARLTVKSVQTRGIRTWTDKIQGTRVPFSNQVFIRYIRFNLHWSITFNVLAKAKGRNTNDFTTGDSVCYPSNFNYRRIPMRDPPDRLPYGRRIIIRHKVSVSRLINRDDQRSYPERRETVLARFQLPYGVRESRLKTNTSRGNAHELCKKLAESKGGEKERGMSWVNWQIYRTAFILETMIHANESRRFEFLKSFFYLLSSCFYAIITRQCLVTL